MCYYFSKTKCVSLAREENAAAYEQQDGEHDLKRALEPPDGKVERVVKAESET